MSDDRTAELNANLHAKLAEERMLQFFAFSHLPPHLQEVSIWFAEVAYTMVAALPRNAERTAGLRKLLEAKDCAVRAKLYKEVGQ